MNEVDDGIRILDEETVAPAGTRIPQPLPEPPPVVTIPEPEPRYTDGEHFYRTPTSLEVVARFSWARELETREPALYHRYGNSIIYVRNQAEKNRLISLLSRYSVEIAEVPELYYVYMDAPSASQYFEGYVIHETPLGVSYSQPGQMPVFLKNEHRLEDCLDVVKHLQVLSNHPRKQRQKEIRRALSGIAALRSERHEDAYLYFLDTPATDPELHEQIRKFLEVRYEEEVAHIKAEEDLINKLRQEEERNKTIFLKGKTKEAFLRANFSRPGPLESLYFHNRRLVFTFKNDLTVEGIGYGRPIVHLNMGSYGRDHTSIVNAEVYSADLRAFVHPHVNSPDSWCMGTHIEPINKALLSLNIPLATAMIWKWLSEYNPASPLVALDTCRTQMSAVRKRELIIRRK